MSASAIGLGMLAVGSDSPETVPRTNSPFQIDGVQRIAALRAFTDCNEFLTWVRAAALDRVGPYGLNGDPIYYALEGGLPVTAPREDASTTPSPDSAGNTTVPNSGTNNQVEGVDEPDVIKTDGNFIYTLAGNRLLIVDRRTDQLVGALGLGQFGGRDLLLDGDRALVIGGGYGVYPIEGEPIDGLRFAPDIYPGPTGSVILELDLSDRSDPKVSERVRIDGAYTSSRIVDGVARIVITADPSINFGFVQPSQPGDRGERRAETMNRALIEESVLSDWLPTWTRVDADGSEQSDPRPLLACEDAAHPEEFSGFSMLTVLTVDLAAGLEAGLSSASGAGVLASGAIIYSNAERLYVAAPEYIEWDKLSNSEQRYVNENYSTDLHRFDISDPTATAYEGSGRVDGTLLNQFAMDDLDGVLRVATTQGSPWSEGPDRSQSGVATFELRDNVLVQVGSVGGLGKGEQIQSVRFIGDTAYVVTFRQTDPLYTIDLRDPAAPKVVGELKILGYSAYLHPIGDGLLLGVGIDANDLGQRTGLQVSLFDVGDPANPQRVAQHTIVDANSAVEWDHHAFTWWPTGDTGGLAYVPFESWNSGPVFEGDSAPLMEPSMGVLILKVDTAGNSITEAGRVTHQGRPTNAQFDKNWLPIDRTVVIGDALWSRSEAGLLRTNLDGTGSAAWVQFPEPDYGE